MPVMRPVFFADPSNKGLRDEDRAFLLGGSLLIVPAWSDNPAMPRGRWYDLKLTGSSGLSDDYQSSMKIKEGTIIPAGRVVQSTSELNEKEKITLIVSLDRDGKASGRLYEDAGDGYSFRDGEYCLSRFSAELKAGKVIVKVSGMEGNNKYESRLVTVAVVDENGVSCGYGNIVNGVNVIIAPKDIAIPQ